MKKVRGRGRSPVAPLCGRGYVEKRACHLDQSERYTYIVVTSEITCWVGMSVKDAMTSPE